MYHEDLPAVSINEASYIQEEATNMAQHVLCVADHYGMDRLKLMCEEELCWRIDEETIMSTYALANRHHCNRLKHACLLFLMQSPDVLGTVLENSGFNELCMTNYLPSPLEGDHVPGANKRSHPEEETDPGQKLKTDCSFLGS